MTSGYTSGVYTTPDEDVGFWYRNLKESYAELDALSNLAEKQELSSLEQSNTLLKLRDTLCDHSEGKERLTCPSGISRFPLEFWLCVVFGDFWCFGFFGSGMGCSYF